MNKLEIIAETLQDCKDIEDSKADRIELVAELDKGGFTPDLELVKKVLESVKIPVAVMVRNTDKTFRYSIDEKILMVSQIKKLKEIGCKDIVIGAIEVNKIDDCFIEKISNICGDEMNICFHRAIEKTSNLEESFKTLSKFKNIKRILISYGFKEEVSEDKLKFLAKMQDKYNIKVMCGGGVNGNNLKYLYSRFDIHIGSYAKTNNVIDKNRLLKIKEELSHERYWC